LKPENVLIDLQGYVKLSDFGLAKEQAGEQTANTVCGTPEYLAPEILSRAGHGKPVDWWCLGCFIYELYVGSPVFENDNRQALYESIQKLQVTLPTSMPLAMKDLLSQLLRKDPGERLGSHKGAAEVKAHPWFAKVNFHAIYKKTIIPPFIPKLRDDCDVSNFDLEAVECAGHSLSCKDPDHYFAEFSFAAGE